MLRSCSFRSIVSIAALGGFAAFASPAAAETIAVTYDITVGGMRALEIKYRAELSGSDYSAKASVDTKGIVSVFAGYELDMAASGSFAGGRAMPASFSSVAERKSKKTRFDLSWTGDDVPKQHQQSDKDSPVREEIDAALGAGVADPLTAVLRLSGSAAEKPCQTKQRIFSGRDVYDLSFSLQKKTTLGKESPGVYRGPAYECRMVYTPVAGRSAKKFRKSNAQPPVFKVWFAEVQSEERKAPILVPIAAQGALNGRKFSAYASKATIGGQGFNQLSKAE